MATVWGLTWIAAKWAFEAAPPILVAALRFICATLCFAVWAAIARLPLATRQPGRLVWSGLLLNTGCYSLVFWGVAHSPTGLAAIINLSLIPVFSMGIGALYGEEVVTRRRIVALGIGIAGLLLLFATRAGGGSVEGGSVLLGLLAVVAGTLAYAWGAIVAKPVVREIPPISLAFWHTLIGGLSLLPISLALEGFDPAWLGGLAHGRPLAGLAFLVLGGSLVGFSAYLWILREWGAFRAGLYSFVSPIIAVSSGVAIMGEPFGLSEAAGMAVMLTATAIVIRPERVSPS